MKREMQSEQAQESILQEIKTHIDNGECAWFDYDSGVRYSVRREDSDWAQGRDYCEIPKVLYGQIDFLGTDGKVGETIYYKDKKSFDAEVHESAYCGEPFTDRVYGKPLSRVSAV